MVDTEATKPDEAPGAPAPGVADAAEKPLVAEKTAAPSTAAAAAEPEAPAAEPVAANVEPPVVPPTAEPPATDAPSAGAPSSTGAPAAEPTTAEAATPVPPAASTTEPAAAVPEAPAAATPAAAEKPAADDADKANKPTEGAPPAVAPAGPGAASVSRAVTNGTTATAAKSTPIDELWETVVSQPHPEMWGVTLQSPDEHPPTRIVLQKFLNANDGDLARAKDQLAKALAWRAEVKPVELAARVFSKKKFDNLGYVTKYGAGAAGDDKDEKKAAEPEDSEVFTWNVYGAVSSFDETFGNLQEFIEWRVALMELALTTLALPTATKPITATYDPYKIFQVHDYRSISFLRSPPVVKSASSETIRIFQQNYPELLKEKFFVNVPAIMGFMYSLMKLFVAPKTIRKFHPMSNGANLAAEFAADAKRSRVPGLSDLLPPDYGGKGEPLAVQGKGPALE